MTRRPIRLACVFILGLAFLRTPAASASAPGVAGPAGLWAAWQAFLARYVAEGSDGIARVRYAQVTPADKAALDACLKAAQAAKVSTLPKEDQRAFWINLYNARTVAAVLDRYPIHSILDITIAGSAKKGPWDAKLLTVEDRELSLNDIEGLLRRDWKDPRIHFALNCASVGCPDLSTEIFTAANTERQLEAGAKKYLASRRGAAFVGDTLTVSSLFDWYRSDFGANDREVLDFLARYCPPGKAERLRAYHGKIAYEYDWSLNTM